MLNLWNLTQQLSIHLFCIITHHQQVIQSIMIHCLFTYVMRSSEEFHILAALFNFVFHSICTLGNLTASAFSVMLIFHF